MLINLLITFNILVKYSYMHQNDKNAFKLKFYFQTIWKF